MLRRVVISVMAVACAAKEAPPPPPPAAPAITPADAAVDAPPDARVPSRPGTLSCQWQHASASELAFGRYTFQGVVPWVGFKEVPVTASCCVLPNETVLCHVTEKKWHYINVEGGTLSTALLLEHTRLFDKNGKAPWLDVVINALVPGPMDDPSGKASAPIFRAHVENDADAFWIVGDRDRVCEPNGKIPCDQYIIESNGCGAYRKRLAPLVKSFCDARGPHPWRGARFESPQSGSK